MATFSITVENNPTVTIVGTSTLCEGTTASLTASGASTYTWNTGSNLSTVAVSPSVNTTYTVSGSSAGGCTGTANTSTILVSVLANPTVGAISSTSLLCTGQTATLTANGAATYSWSNGSSNSTVAISPTITTTYTVTGTSTVGCSNTATVTQNVSACTGVEPYAANTANVSMSPNPGNGKYTLHYTGDFQDATVQIFDLTGKLILKQELRSDITAIDISAFENGVYFSVITGKGQSTAAIKIIKQ